MIDYEINNDVECPYCFHSPLYNRGCRNLCDNGFFDESETDPISHYPGESLIPCHECKGTGTEWWCPQCGANLSDKLKECGFEDDNPDQPNYSDEESPANYPNELKKRIEQVRAEKDTDSIITFSEIKLTNEQMKIIAIPLIGLDESEMIRYYRNKVHGNLLLSQSKYTTREDQPDIQYLVDLGIKALESGMRLDK